MKNRLSTYLNEVREGEEILVRDRNRPIAKIVPLSHADLEAQERALIASGFLRPAEGPLPASFWSMPGPRIPMKRAIAAVLADQKER